MTLTKCVIHKQTYRKYNIKNNKLSKDKQVQKQSLKKYTERLKQIGSDNSRLPLTEIDDETIVKTFLLCHEIDLYIKDNSPDIDPENLKAFKKIYYKSSALKTKIQNGQTFV